MLSLYTRLCPPKKSEDQESASGSAEEHNILGGLGESVARTLASKHPVPQEFIGTNDTFGESGTPAQLMEKYGLNAAAITTACEKVIKRK